MNSYNHVCTMYYTMRNNGRITHKHEIYLISIVRLDKNYQNARACEWVYIQCTCICNQWLTDFKLSFALLYINKSESLINKHHAA